MKNKLVNAATGRSLSPIQYKVFRKIMSIYGPKRPCANPAERWMRAYCKAQKDFEDIYGFKPELMYRDNKSWRYFDDMKND